MTCQHFHDGDHCIHICRPSFDYIRRITLCPNCKVRRRFILKAQDYYDTIWTCCACGDSWTAEGRMERPFKPGWRKERISRAKSDWAKA